MKNKITKTEAKKYIHESATISRYYNNQIELERKEIESLLLVLFPTLEGKNEDGPEDWSCDILNAENAEEVDSTLKRIADIENRKTALFKIKILNQQATKLRNEIEEINAEIVRLQNL